MKNKIKYALLYSLAIMLILIIAFIISAICLSLICSLWFSIPMTWLALNIFATPILDYVKKHRTK